MTGYAAHDEQFVFVQDRSMAGTTFWYWARHLRLCPVGSLQVEDDEVGEICSMFVLSAEYEQFVALV